MTFILFEEPEAFLHPPQQELLARNLRGLAKVEGHQVLCSTHSSHFVSKNAEHIPSISHLRREKGCVTVCQIDHKAWDEIVDANQAINKIAPKWSKLKKRLDSDDLKPEMEAVKYFLWLNPDRCGLFFANHVLMVEGPSEQAFINKLLGDGIIKLPNNGVYILDTIGKYNMHRFMNLLSHIGIPHSVLHDDDNNQNEHADLNQLIQDSKHHELTVTIQTIPDKLESFLGLPSPTSEHRKPQHLLFHHESGLIKDDKLRAFCSLVEGCIPII